MIRSSTLGLIGLLAASAPARQPPQFDLDSALQTGQENSLHLRRLDLEIRAARADARAAAAPEGARFFAALRKELEDFRTFKFPPFVGLTQPFDLFGNRRAARAVADHDIALAELALEGFRQGLVHEVTQRYRDLQFRQDLHAAAGFSTQLAAGALDVARRRARAGASASVDQVRAETQHLRARGREQEAYRDVLRARRRLGEALGQVEWRSLSPPDHLPGLRANLEASSLLDLARARRVDLRALDQRASRWAAESRLARQRRKPVVSGELAVKQEEDQTFGYGGVRVDLAPLWDTRLGFENQGRRLRAQGADLHRQDLLRRTRIRVSGLLAELGSLRARLDLFEEDELPSTERELVMVDQGYRRGGLDSLAVVEAQRSAAQSVEAYLRTLHAFHEGLLELRREVGMADLDLAPSATSLQIRRWLAPGLAQAAPR